MGWEERGRKEGGGDVKVLPDLHGMWSQKRKRQNRLDAHTSVLSFLVSFLPYPCLSG